MKLLHRIKPYILSKRIFSYFLLLFLPAVIFYSMEFFLCNPFEKQRFPIQLLNIFFFELFAVLGLCLLKKAKYILRILCVIFSLAGLVNYFVLSFRGTPFMPWDLLSLRTAASVADNYSYKIEGKIILLLLLFLLLFFVSGQCDIIIRKRKLRVSVMMLSLFLLAGTYTYVQSDSALKAFRFYDKLFTPTTMTYRNGTLVTLILQAKYLFVEKPDGYTAKEAELLLSTYENEKHPTNENTDLELLSKTSALPNIIVIMNEAFSDLNILGEFSSNKDPIPFIHSMLEGHKNTISGYVNVSVLGGNTANSEYEFLTSHTMAFLPQGSIPYQQYLRDETFSLASYLKSFGYKTVALHPYGASGWQRDQVYPKLGFDSFYSLEDFTAPEKIRNYVSDKENYEMIRKIYERKERGKPLFLFNVTMQNHSSYTESFPNFSPSITVNNSDSPSLSNYLSLLNISDKEIENLVSYFSNQEEKTLLLFFGDHQPTDSVVRDIWINSKKDPDNLSLSDQMLRYQVPFFLWANYDIKEAQQQESSLNYLALSLLQEAKLPFNSYYHFIQKQQELFPVISAIQTKDSSYESFDITEKKEALNDYAKVQYYMLFDHMVK